MRMMRLISGSSRWNFYIPISEQITSLEMRLGTHILELGCATYREFLCLRFPYKVEPHPVLSGNISQEEFYGRNLELWLSDPPED